MDTQLLVGNPVGVQTLVLSAALQRAIQTLEPDPKGGHLALAACGMLESGNTLTDEMLYQVIAADLTLIHGAAITRVKPHAVVGPFVIAEFDGATIGSSHADPISLVRWGKTIWDIQRTANYVNGTASNMLRYIAEAPDTADGVRSRRDRLNQCVNAFTVWANAVSKYDCTQSEALAIQSACAANVKICVEEGLRDVTPRPVNRLARLFGFAK